MYSTNDLVWVMLQLLSINFLWHRKTALSGIQLYILTNSECCLQMFTFWLFPLAQVQWLISERQQYGCHSQNYTEWQYTQGQLNVYVLLSLTRHSNNIHKQAFKKLDMLGKRVVIHCQPWYCQGQTKETNSPMSINQTLH